MDRNSAMYHYPALVGAEKQVAWAMRIRRDVMSNVQGDYAKMWRIIDASEAAQPHNAANAQVLRDVCNAAYDRIANTTDAGFWLDNRETVGLFGRVANEVKAERLAAK